MEKVFPPSREVFMRSKIEIENGKSFPSFERSFHEIKNEIENGKSFSSIKTSHEIKIEIENGKSFSSTPSRKFSDWRCLLRSDLYPAAWREPVLFVGHSCSPPETLPWSTCRHGLDPSAQKSLQLAQLGFPPLSPPADPPSGR